MKKLFALIFIFIIFMKNYDMISYAEQCSIPSINVKEIDFSKIIDGDATTYTQTFKDKIVELVSYEDIPKLDKILGEKMQDAALKLVKAWSSKIDLKNAIKIANYLQERTLYSASPHEIVAQKINALRDLTKNAYLYEDEQVNAQLMTIDKAFESAGEMTTVAGVTGASVGILTTGALWLGNMAALCPAILIGGGAALAALGVFTVSYNKIINWSTEGPALENLRRTMNLIMRVGDEIFNHNWIDKNILIMSTSSISGCEKTDAQFKKIDGIKYNSLKAVSNWFAQIKCKFVNDNSKSCWQNVLEEINCLTYDKENLFCLDYPALAPNKYLTYDNKQQAQI